MSSFPVQILDVASAAPIAAELIDGLGPQDLELVERAWGPERSRIRMELARRGIPRKAFPQSLHWNWQTKAAELRTISATGFAIVLESKWEGVMMTKTSPWTSRLPASSGQHLVYVDYVEAAPWNWVVTQIGQAGRFRGIGSLLIRRAVIQSVEEEFHGRIGLHALPQSEKFYSKRCGMISLGRDGGKENLLYLELDEEGANKFLEGGLT